MKKINPPSFKKNNGVFSYPESILFASLYAESRNLSFFPEEMPKNLIKIIEYFRENKTEFNRFIKLYYSDISKRYFFKN